MVDLHWCDGILLGGVAVVWLEELDGVKDLSHAHRVRPADVAPGRRRSLVHQDEGLGDVPDVHNVLHLVVGGVAVASEVVDERQAAVVHGMLQQRPQHPRWADAHDVEPSLLGVGKRGALGQRLGEEVPALVALLTKKIRTNKLLTLSEI